MYVKKNLILWLAVFALALPLLLAGTAGAKYMQDGAVQDPSGGFKTPTDGICVISIDASGNMVTDPTITSARDCQARLVSVTSTTGANAPLSAVCTNPAQNSAGVRYAAPGSNTCVTIDGSGYITGSKSMKNRDRGAIMCSTLGGQLASAVASTVPLSNGAVITVSTKTTANGTAATCIAYNWLYRGQDANGTPLPFSAKGTSQTDMGYCYSTMRMATATTKNGSPINYSTAAGCPASFATGTTGFNADAAYDWSATNCTYSKGNAGILNAALTKVDGTNNGAAGTYKDLSVYTTYGDCLANGGSWANWFGKPATFDAYATPLGTASLPAWDYQKQAPDADDGCLHCHSYVAQQNGPAERFKDSYLKTGHKNMLRKVTAGNVYAGADNVPYTAYAAGTLNFATPSAQVGGVDKPLLYLFGDWMAAAPLGLDVVVDMGAGVGAKYNGTSNYSCAACHSTGWNNIDGVSGVCVVGTVAKPTTTTQAACGTAGGTWYPLIGVKGIGNAGFTPQEPAASFPTITFSGAGKWDLEGITCGRCHNAAVGPVNAAMVAASQFPTTNATSGGMGSIPGGPAAYTYSTGLCFGCHQSMPKTAAGTGADTDLVAPQQKITMTNTAVAPAYVPSFSSHPLGNMFLNSVHARYTGNVVPNSLGKFDLAAGGTYNSAFKGFTCWQSSSSSSPAKTDALGAEIKDKATCDGLYGAGSWRAETQGGCSTCHDVHQSMFVTGQEGLRKECESCHENATYAAAVPAGTQVDMTLHKHPKGTNTPFDTSKHVNSCEVCHMPNPADKNFPMHVWRINTDAAYSTFPTYAQFNGICSNGTSTTSAACGTAGGTWTAPTQKIANTALDSKGYPAVWVDLDLACGQCHDGSIPSIMPISKAALASSAKNFHTGGTIAPGSGTKPVVSQGTTTLTGWTVMFTDATSPSGTNTSVTVNWGDGVYTTAAAGSVFSHDYSRIWTKASSTSPFVDGGDNPNKRARMYNIYVKAVSNVDPSLFTTASFKMNVPQRFAISGNVTAIDGVTPFPGGATISLKQNGHTLKTAKGTSFNFTSMTPGAYTVSAYKYKSTFNVITIPTLNTNVTVTISAQ